MDKRVKVISLILAIVVVVTAGGIKYTQAKTARAEEARKEHIQSIVAKAIEGSYTAKSEAQKLIEAKHAEEAARLAAEEAARKAAEEEAARIAAEEEAARIAAEEEAARIAAEEEAARIASEEAAQAEVEEYYYEEPSSGMTYLGTYEITAYEWTGNPCANGNYPTVGYTVACNSLPLGTQVYIEGVGYRTVEDRGATWHSSSWIDLYLGDVSSCYAWGRQYLDVYIVD